jgi:YesN/AraC family two-component response regulator
MLINHFSKKDSDRRNTTEFDISAIESFSPDLTEGDASQVARRNYTMIWVQKGTGDLTIDVEQFKIEEDTVYFAKPGQELTANINEPVHGFIISFAREFLELYEKSSTELSNTPLFNHSCVLPVIHINKETSSLMKNIADKMLQEFRNYYDLRAEVLRGLLKIFVIYLSRQLEYNNQNSFKPRKTELVNVFFNLLEKSFATKKMVRDYAEALSVTPGYLNDTVKEISGFTASYHIQQRIVLEAKRRAIYEGDSLKEIAYYLGFCDPAHFSKYFKNSSGTNFTDFKKGAYSFY